MDPRVQKQLDEQELQEQEAKRAAEEKRLRRCIVRTFSTLDGQETLSMLRREFYDVDGFVPGQPADSHAAAAQRNVVLRILTVLAEEADGKDDPQETAET